MLDTGKILLFALLLSCLPACDRPTEEPAGVAGSTDPAAAGEPDNTVVIKARGMRFEGDDSAASGWTTIRLDNLDDMLHFAMVVRLPDGVSANMYSDDLGAKFQQAYELMLAGDDEKVAEVFASVPEWVGQLSYHGGPGFTGGKQSAESTQYLEPGNYVVECYIKSNGVFHSYSPVPGQLAMLLPLTVTEEVGGMAEPGSDATLTIDDSGIHLSAGALQAGENTIRVEFDTQTRYPSFVGQDVHVMRINGDADVRAALDWMDWRTPSGLLVPAPVTFVGGINDVMPAGSTAYFTVDLSAGRYAFIGEAPEADGKGLLLEFEIPDSAR